MDGYSGTPLPRKLGITGGTDVLVLGDPLSFDLHLLGAAVSRVARPESRYPVVLLFCPELDAMTQHFGAATAATTPAGGLWVCWPKRSSKVVTDLTETDVRAFGLAAGRVDVKVAAVDPTWSGLKFVVRSRDR